MKSPSDKLSRIAKSISPDDARHFAETKHDKLPEKASFDKSLDKAPRLEKQMTMDGQKQAVTRRSWDDARFESVVGALSKVKVPKVKKPEKEEQTVDMSKQSMAAQLGYALGKSAGAMGAPRPRSVLEYMLLRNMKQPEDVNIETSAGPFRAAQQYREPRMLAKPFYSRDKDMMNALRTLVQMRPGVLDKEQPDESDAVGFGLNLVGRNPSRYQLPPEAEAALNEPEEEAELSVVKTSAEAWLGNALAKTAGCGGKKKKKKAKGK